MKRFNSQEDIHYYTAQETGLSLEHVKFLEKELWNSVRFYLANPLMTKKGILLSKSMKFYPRQQNLYKAKELSKDPYYKKLYNDWYEQAEYGQTENGYVLEGFIGDDAGESSGFSD